MCFRIRIPQPFAKAFGLRFEPLLELRVDENEEGSLRFGRHSTRIASGKIHLLAITDFRTDYFCFLRRLRKKCLSFGLRRSIALSGVLRRFLELGTASHELGCSTDRTDYLARKLFSLIGGSMRIR